MIGILFNCITLQHSCLAFHAMNWQFSMLNQRNLKHAMGGCFYNIAKDREEPTNNLYPFDSPREKIITLILKFESRHERLVI